MTAKNSILRTPGVAPDLEVIVMMAGRFGLDLPEKATPTKLVGLIRAEMARRLEGVPEDDWVLCSRCGEHSPDSPDIDCCPYCGDEGADPAGDQKVVDIEEARQKRAPIATVKKTKSKLVEKAQTGLAEMKEQFAQCDSAVDAGMKGMSSSAYDMGVALLEIHKGELWKAGGHKSFSAYSRTRGISQSLAYSLMSVAKKFAREDFERVGRSKLSLVAKLASGADDDERAEIVKNAEGKTKSQIRAEINSVKRREPKPAEERAPSVPPPPTDKITLLAKVDGKTKQHYNWKDGSGAQKKVYEKGCVVEIRISDDVVMFIENRVSRDGESTGLSVSFRRAEA